MYPLTPHTIATPRGPIVEAPPAVERRLGNATVWLIFAGYMFTLGYTRTGLGKCLAVSFSIFATLTGISILLPPSEVTTLSVVV